MGDDFYWGAILVFFFSGDIGLCLGIFVVVILGEFLVSSEWGLWMLFDFLVFKTVFYIKSYLVWGTGVGLFVFYIR